jgi:hypothetical protein
MKTQNTGKGDLISILGFAGSLRKGSYNKVLLREASELFLTAPASGSQFLYFNTQ